MTTPNDQPPQFLLGLQLGIFEVVWPTFRWIRKIWLLHDHQLHLFVETDQTIEQEERADLERLIEELLQAMTSDDKHAVATELPLGYGPRAPSGYTEIFSESIFRQVAEKHAPWRLESGR